MLLKKAVGLLYQRLYVTNHPSRASATFSGGVSFGWYGEDPNEVTTLLNLNKAENKHEVIRQKLFRYYFSENKNLHEIANIDDEVLPRLLGAIAKDLRAFK